MWAPRRILVRLPNWLGDVLLARPLLHALRRALPAASIAAVAPAPLLELLGPDGCIDAAEPWPREREGREQATRALRERRPELALVLPPSFSSAWLAWRTGATQRVGYAHEGRSPLLTLALRRPPRGDVHLADEYLALARAACGDVPGPGVVPELRLSDAATTAGRVRLGRLGVAPRGFAVIGPGARYGPAKRWPAERYAAVGRMLVEHDLEVLVCGAGDEVETCEQVAGAIGRGAHSLAGGTTLPELAGVCAMARVAVCNDSGLAHLCAAVGAPTVAVFGSTSSAWTAPIGAAVRIVQRSPVCSPCFRPNCRVGFRCLMAVSERRVWRACEELLARGAA